MGETADIIKNQERFSTISIKSMAEYDPSQYSELLDEVMLVEEEAWPKEWRATRDKFASRLAIFPEGFFVAFKGGRMVGVTTSEIINYDPERLPLTWDEITDNGCIKDTHDPHGNSLYVTSVGVSKKFQGQGIGRSIIEAQKQLVQRLNLKCLFLGARLPMYHEYHRSNSKVSVEDYMKLEKSPGKKFDPEIRFYESVGLKVVEVMPNYGPDRASENYGVIMVWENPDFRI